MKRALGLTGAALGLGAGVVQVTVGSQIPEWTGNKADPVPLGLLTVALAVLAGIAAAARQRSPGARTAHAAALLGPGLLGLTTVGRLWYLPAALLITAGLVVAPGPRAITAVLVAARWRILLGLLGGCELLMAGGAPPSLMIIGAVSGLVLIATAATAHDRRTLVTGLALGTLPFAATAWTALVPLLVTTLATTVTLPLLRSQDSAGGS